MQFGLRVTSRTSLQIPPQPVLPDSEEIPRDADQPYLAQSIISPKHGLEVPLQTEAPPPKACSSPGPAGKSCWNLDIRVAMLVLALAGVVIVLLLYRLLQMRHRCVRSTSRTGIQDATNHCYFHCAPVFCLCLRPWRYLCYFGWQKIISAVSQRATYYQVLKSTNGKTLVAASQNWSVSEKFPCKISFKR